MSEKDKNEAMEEPEDEKSKFKNISEELFEEIDECFEIFDKDKDNYISYFDLTSLLRWLKFNPTEREMKRYVELYDTTKSNLVTRKTVYEIVDQKVLEPDTIEELVEAMKLLDINKDGTIQISEFRFAMTKLGDAMDETSVDEMVKEIDPDGKGFVDIFEFAKICFAIKEKKSKD